MDSSYNYRNNLNKVLIQQTQNELFYSGNIESAAQSIVKEVANALKVDRSSVWVYNYGETQMRCQSLYVKSENQYYQDIVLRDCDYPDYFEALRQNPIIAAQDVNTHPATACFKETYTDLLGIKSMLDVPIWYRGKLLGVICNESLSSREWLQDEIDFSQMLSAMYSFAYSMHEANKLMDSIKEMENFIETSSIISKADKEGKVTYINDKFTDISGYTLDEVVGKDHNIVNSGTHPKEFWKEMYATVHNKEIWHNVVTNKAKDGSLYYVDSYIKANYDKDTEKLLGYTSIRQDVTKIIESLQEIDKKNTYLEHAAKIIRHDMHSGINTYIPRGLNSLERRLTEEDIQNLKIEAPLKMIREGLKHAQKVYNGVYAFTNLVKKDSVLPTESYNIQQILYDFLKSTAYLSNVTINELPTIEVNESLFCTALDNLIRNGLKYNDNEYKKVVIYHENDTIVLQDNGRGLTQEEFEKLSEPYTRKIGQAESGSGLGLNICKAILDEHGFTLSCEKNEIGTKMKIKYKNV